MLAITALLAGGIAAPLGASTVSSAASLRAQVDSIGQRYLAAQEQARALDLRLRDLDAQLAISRRRTARLLPQAKARAVQLYQAGAQGLTVLFDVSSAMESARRAELIARADDHTQALLDDYARSAARLQLERAQLAAARAKQAKLVASLAGQERALDRALALAQQRYRAQLAAETIAKSTQRTSTRQIVTDPAPPRAPVPVDPPPPPRAGENPHHNEAFLVCTRTRESSGYYGAVNPAGYYGAYQFSQPTWDLTASHAGEPQLIGVRPDRASAWDQDELAWSLYQWRGNAPWGGLC